MKPYIKKRYIEYLRVISMLSVVAIHVCITALSDFSPTSVWESILYLDIRNIFHFAVPVFFMISGALMFPPEKDLTIKKLLRRYILKYGAVIVIFGWVYALLEDFFNYHEISISSFIRSFIGMLEGKTWNHMWYMYTLFGIMLIVPILRAIVIRFNQNEIKFFVIISGLFLSIMPIVSHYCNFELGVELPFNSVYCVYMLLGFWIDSGTIKIPKKLSILGIIVSPIIITGLSVAEQLNWMDSSVWVGYSSPLIAAFAISCFGFAKNVDVVKETKVNTPAIIEVLGKYSFGIYIIHMLWINILYKLLKISPFVPNALLGFMVMWILVIVASVVSSAIMKKIPILKNVV